MNASRFRVTIRTSSIQCSVSSANRWTTARTAKALHGFGSLARANGPVSFHDNLWIHNAGRNPRMGDNYGRGTNFPTFDFRNNVIYDFGYVASGLTQGNLRVNYRRGQRHPPRPHEQHRRKRPRITIGPKSDMQFFIR